MADNDRLHVNGIDGNTGQYAVPPLEYSQAASFIKGEFRDNALVGLLKRLFRAMQDSNLGLPMDVDPAVVAQAGWGVVFHTAEDPVVINALAPLIDHRRKQIGDDNKIKVLDYRTGESRAEWLGRHQVDAGNVEPTKVPFYLLLVGSSERIPFVFGQLLNVEYAIGRLHFDAAPEYAHYVANLIDYETTSSVPSAKDIAFWAPRHAFDRATQLSADLLVNPLADGVPAKGGQSALPGVPQRWGFRSRKIWGNAATKSALVETFMTGAGGKPPALLFTASHGMVWPRGHANQRSAQGALLCQDWPGFGTMKPEYYFSARDIPVASEVHGMISFHFACYSAGTPATDRFFHNRGEPPPTIADEPFIAALPKALLTHPKGAALACIGHVERAWGYSITSPKAGSQLLPFRNAICRILSGQPVGYSIRDFNERYAALSTTLSAMLEELSFNPKAVSDHELAAHWIQRNDAEGYMVLGDPAVQLRVNKMV